MIIRGNAIHDLTTLLEGLGGAARSLLHISVQEDGRLKLMTSGWLITDSLAVVPAFSVSDDDGSYDCRHGTRTIAATRLWSGAGEAPALLRLAEPLLGQALTLATRTPSTGDELFVLQHPRGDPAQSVSIGRLLAVDDGTLHHDAGTEPGSAGGPVLDATWALVGMHTGSSAVPGEEQYNTALAVPAMLAALRLSPAWAEIAAQHRLADVAAMRRALDEPVPRTAPSDELLAAAVRWDFDRTLLSATAVAQLEPLVARPSAERWVLPVASRVEALQAAGSLETLREARGEEPADGPGQAVIDRILAGPPYALDEVDEPALPYWLQATRWFAGVVPELPDPAEVRRTLARRRVRSRLEATRGDRFRGRDDELGALRAWHADAGAGPMVVTGIGGVGKSALVAAFALELPAKTLQLWLDFDRADVAPDDPESVLRLLFEQMATQFDGFTPPALEETTWQDAVAALRPVLAPYLANAPPPLLVLDGFEVAQHALEHREIWQLLDELLPALPGLRILVSGRAPVGELTLGGRPAGGLHLDGLAQEDAVAWLLEQGFESERVATRVAEITHGVPLGLRLAVRWQAAGGDPDELPDEGAPQWYIDGFLYDRILDRVMDPELTRLAKDALVLRRVTPEMIPRVLADSAPEGDRHDIFDRLAREMALVGEGAETSEALGMALPGAGVLRLRPEVRTATLQLLSTEDAARVREIDQRAAAFYDAAEPDDVVNAAELVYHRLRLGDVDRAALAWRDGCVPLLLYADEEVPEGPPREWLRARTAAPATGAEALSSWEIDAYERIRELLQRGVIARVAPILAERAARGPDSPLILYDALVRRWDGDRQGARDVLAGAPLATGTVARDRALAGAWLDAEDGRRADADRALEPLDETAVWSDRQEPLLDVLTLAAARVRLRIDVAGELELVRGLDDDPSLPHMVRAFVPTADIVTARLQVALHSRERHETLGETILIPRDPAALPDFERALQAARRRTMPALDWRTDTEAVWSLDWPATQLAGARELIGDENVTEHQARMVELSHLGNARWRYAAQRGFLLDASDLALRAEPAGDPQVHAVTGTLAAFATQLEPDLVLVHDRAGSLGDLFARLLDPRQFAALSYGPEPAFPIADLGETLVLAKRTSKRTFQGPWDARTLRTVAEFAQKRTHAERALLYHLLTPDPLEMLVRRVAGLSDRLQT